MIQLFERMTIGRALIIGALVGAIYYFIMFDNGAVQEQTIQANTVEVQRLQAEIAKLDTRLQQAADFQKASESLGNSIQKLLSYIPANFTVGQFMKTVSQEARVAGLDIRLIQPQEIPTQSEQVEDFKELGVTMELAGQYDQLLSFMSSLTRKRQIFIFEKIELLSEVGVNTVKGQIKAVAEIRAYSYQGKSQ